MERREFVGSILYPLGAGPAVARAAAAWRDPARTDWEAIRGPAHASDEASAQDEDYWAGVAAAFTMDRTIVNLNNGGVSPSPRVVQEAYWRHFQHANATPPPVALWQEQQPRREVVRSMLAHDWGVDAEEIAITRNASESLQACQFGLDLRPGDEVLTTTHDYPRMLTTFRQRERREGIVLRQVRMPMACTDPSALVAALRSGITERTKVILCCHVVNITGQVLPVREIAAMGREAGAEVIVDGAHAFAHLDYTLGELGCDYYGVSLHKWLFAPHGTGLLYVRRAKIAGLWPLMAAADTQSDNIRKFEEIGTHPEAPALAIAEAIAFHRAIGPSRKFARMRRLRAYWWERLKATGRARLHSPPEGELSCGIGNVQIEGIDTTKLADHLWRVHRILTVAIKHEEFEGLRITPSVYTTLPELDRFCDAVEKVVRDGLPPA